MNHKVILFLIAASALICANLAEAQQSKKLPRIGYLSPSDPGSESTRSDRFRVALRELGYIEGQNIAIEYRYAEGRAVATRSLRPSWCVSRLMSSW